MRRFFIFDGMSKCNNSEQKVPYGWWTKERAFEESKKYVSRTEFCRHAKGAYVLAASQGWLDEMPWLKVVRRKRWTKEDVIHEARQYQTIREFINHASGAYQAALRNDWLKDFTWLEYGFRSWDRDSVLAESHKYKTRTEFARKCVGAYMYATKHGMLDEMTWLQLKVRTPWTREDCLEESRKYTTRKDFSEQSSGAYSVALNNGWLDEMTWLALLVHPEWTKEECIQLSKKYISKKDFKDNANGAYQAASKNGWLDEMIWLKPPILEKIKETNNHCVYVYFDEENKACYVGRTNRLAKRDREHRKPYAKPDSLKRHFDSIESEIPSPVVLKDQLLPTESQYWEDYYCEYFRQQGYRMINRAKTGVNVGSLGGGFIKWDKDTTMLESKKYRTFGEFALGSASAYQAAKRYGWINDITWLTYDQMPNGYWSKERVIDESRKYSTRAEMEKGSPAAYSAALKNGWSKDLPLPYLRVRRHNYSKEDVLLLSKECKSRSEFKQKYASAYILARKSGWLEEMIWLSPRRTNNE